MATTYVRASINKIETEKLANGFDASIVRGKFQSRFFDTFRFRPNWDQTETCGYTFAFNMRIVIPAHNIAH